MTTARSASTERTGTRPHQGPSRRRQPKGATTAARQVAESPPRQRHRSAALPHSLKLQEPTQHANPRAREVQERARRTGSRVVAKGAREQIFLQHEAEEETGKDSELNATRTNKAHKIIQVLFPKTGKHKTQLSHRDATQNLKERCPASPITPPGSEAEDDHIPKRKDHEVNQPSVEHQGHGIITKQQILELRPKHKGQKKAAIPETRTYSDCACLAKNGQQIKTDTTHLYSRHAGSRTQPRPLQGPAEAE